MKKKEHRTKTISGIKWSTFGQILVQLVSVGVGLLLARLLGPEAFGLIGMITVFTGFLSLFKDFGLGSALIHKQEIDNLDKNTAFWANLIVGTFLMLLLIGSAQLIANFYEEALLKQLIIAMSAIFIIQSFGYIQLSILQKNLFFKKIFWIDTIGISVSGIAAIIFAYSGFGVWSLVLQAIIKTSIITVIIIYYSNWRPTFEFSKERLKVLMNYSLPLLGTKTLHFWTRNADNLLIGKFLNTTSLGYYTRAYSLMLFPVRKISGVVSNVMFPSFSIIQDDKQRVKAIYLKVSRIISVLTFPIAVAFFLTAEPFVYGILGAEWAGAIDVIKILSLSSAVQSISTLDGNIFLSQGATRLQFHLSIFTGITMIGFIVLGLQYDIEGVALSVALGLFIFSLPVWHYMGKLINCTVVEILKNILPIVLFNSLILFIGILINQFLIEGDNYVVQLILILAYVGGASLLLFYIFKPLAHRELFALVKEQIAKRK